VKKSEIFEQVKKLRKEYLSNSIQDELIDYAKFFTKPNLIQPKSVPLRREVAKLTSLVLDLQIARERVVVIYLNVKKTIAILKTFEKEILTRPKLKKKYTSLKNAEQREMFLYEHTKPIKLSLIRAKFMAESAETIMYLIDRHVTALKDNAYVLRAMIRTRE